MTDERRIRRGSLFDAFRRAMDGHDVSGASIGRTPARAANVRPPTAVPIPNTAGFSLVSFYEKRASAGVDDSYLPQFELRAGLPEITTVAAYAEPVAPTFAVPNSKVKA